jgi:hypothetical protein
MNFVNTFQKIGLTIAAIIFSCAALFYAINPVKADNPTLTNSTGKYMMDQNAFVFKDFNYHILVWDTETGKSKLYRFSDGSWSNNIAQLPSSPLY